MPENITPKTDKRIKIFRKALLIGLLILFAYVTGSFFYQLVKIRSRTLHTSLVEFNSLLTKKFLSDTTLIITDSAANRYPVGDYSFKNGYRLVIKKYRLKYNQPLSSIVTIDFKKPSFFDFDTLNEIYQNTDDFSLTASAKDEVTPFGLMKFQIDGNCQTIVQNDTLLVYHLRVNAFVISHDEIDYANISGEAKTNKNVFLSIAFLKRNGFCYLLMLFQQPRHTEDFSAKLLAEGIN